MMYPVLVGRPTCIGIMYQCNMYDLNVPFHNSVSAVFRVQGNYRSLPLLYLLLWLVFVYIRNRLPNSYHEKKSSHMVYYTMSFQIFESLLLHQHSSCIVAYQCVLLSIVVYEVEWHEDDWLCYFQWPFISIFESEREPIFGMWILMWSMITLNKYKDDFKKYFWNQNINFNLNLVNSRAVTIQFVQRILNPKFQ